MKAIFISYDQAYNMDLVELLERHECRGFTMWSDIAGRGTDNGEPHLGNHAWPTMNNAILTIVPDDKTDSILNEIKTIDRQTPKLGLRAFVWNIEHCY